MRARWWWALLLSAGTAAAEPKPKPVDIKPLKDKLVVLQDSDGGTYVVFPATGSGEDARMFYGLPKKPLYEQVVTGRSADGSTGAWDVNVWAPRVPNFQPGSVGRRPDGTFQRFCGNDNITPLTQVGSDKAKAILDKGPFMTTAMIRRPYMLARDDSGVYYYVDVIRDAYGGNGYRVFVGKKGAMKLKPLTDIAKDTGGDVFSTKTGDLRIVRDVSENKTDIAWIKGGKRSPLVVLDVDANETLIFTQLGIYGSTGNICDTL